MWINIIIMGGYMKKSVLVVGTARSGTSLTCGVIDCLGVKMLTVEPKPHQLRHNPKGMYELPGLLGFGAKLNKEANQSTNIPEAARNLQEVFDKELFQYAPKKGNWGIKSPTITKGIDLLLYHMPNCHVVFVFRNIVDHAKSFQMFRFKIDGIKTPLTELMKEIAAHNLTIANKIDELKALGYPVEITTYEHLRSEPIVEVGRIASFLDIEVTDEIKEKVMKFVDPTIHTWKDEGRETLPIEIDFNE